MNRWAAATLLGTFCVCPAIASASPSGANFERAFFAMGTRLEISIPGVSRKKALQASENAFAAILRVEKRLSTWRADSELSRLNQSPVGHEVQVSIALYQDLSSALSCAQKTGFAFNPWMGPLVQAWGLRSGGKIPSDTKLKEALSSTRSGAFELKGGKIIRKIPGAAFEEGGFGKGAGLDDAISSLKKDGIREAVLGFGGQISVLGKSDQQIEIADPSQRDRTLLRFQMKEGSVATSSNSEHGLQVAKRKVGHLLDPATGQPAPFEGSTTVIASTGASADCMTKVFVLSPEKSFQWAEQNHVELLRISPVQKTENGARWIAEISCAWSHPLEKISSDVEIRTNCSTSEKEREK